MQLSEFNSVIEYLLTKSEPSTKSVQLSLMMHLVPQAVEYEIGSASLTSGYALIISSLSKTDCSCLP